jgi:beta-lactamase regulating signal transducer with metallopeptidase domain
MIVFDPSTVTAIASKTGLLIVAVGLIAVLAARQSAARLNFLWTSALILSLLMPIAVVTLPSYVRIALPWAAVEPWGSSDPLPVASGARHADAGPDALAPDPDELSPRASRDRAAWPTTMIVWLVGALAMMLRNALAHGALIRWLRHARPRLSPAWSETLRRVASEAAICRPVRVLESVHAPSPCTFGFLRPVVLLPAAGAGWPEPQRRFTLLHELAHVRRMDWLTTQIAGLACAVHWYNPLVWFAAVQARKLQERACDDVVLNAGGTPSDYAQFLVSIAGGSRSPLLEFPAAVGMVQRSQLHGRVIAILDASRMRLPLGRLAANVALAPLAGLAFFLATLSVGAEPAARQPGVPLTASFSSVELRNGGTVNLIHGASQRVTVLDGEAQEASISIRDGGRLVIDRCPADCPHGHEFEVEVVTPGLAAIAVAEGGTIRSRGDFPRQAGIGVAVSQGGTIDVRSMDAANVTASVESGGRVFVKPASALTARIEQGGVVTYWGDAIVESSVRHGGAVTRGLAADLDRPLAEFGPELLPAVPPIPPVPPDRTVHSIDR